MMEIVRGLDTGRWKDFVCRHPQSNIFHTPEMFEVFARAKGHRPELWAVLDAGQVLALLLPVQITLTPLLRAFTTRVVSYGGLLCNLDSQGLAAARQLLEAYVKQTGQSAILSEFRNLHDHSPLRVLYHKCGFTYEKHLNYLVDLAGPSEVVFQHIGSRTRKNLRRALSRGDVKISEATHRADVAACHGLIRRSYQRAHVPLADWSLFEAAFELLVPRGMLRFYLARVGDVPVAASAELSHKEILYGWYSGVERSYRNYVPGELLMWHVLQWGAENGYHTYDFGGAGKPSEEYGVRDFKAKFGGRLVEYGRFTVTHAPIRIGLSKLGYHIYQQLPWFWSDYHRK